MFAYFGMFMPRQTFYFFNNLGTVEELIHKKMSMIQLDFERHIRILYF